MHTLVSTYALRPMVQVRPMRVPLRMCTRCQILLPSPICTASSTSAEGWMRTFGNRSLIDCISRRSGAPSPARFEHDNRDDALRARLVDVVLTLVDLVGARPESRPFFTHGDASPHRDPLPAHLNL